MAGLTSTPMAGAKQQPTSTTSSNTQTLRMDDLERRVTDLERIVDMVLLPIGVLVGILSLGGVIGIVFSIRDQRRVSQLHELSISGEMSAQRRSDQNYNTFLEASQKTLTLVNDTLELAKEATHQATHTMQVKAGANLDSIEEAAEDLLLNVIERGDFEEVVDLPNNRARLQTIASEVAALEGYLLLQDMQLLPYSRFVKGIEQFLKDDVTGALHTLRQAAQDTSNRQLQRCALYWTAKLNNAIGRYDQASRLLEQAEEHLATDSVEWYELEQARIETDFFRRADSMTDALPEERLAAVAKALSRLERVAAGLESRTKDDDDQHANHEVAATRADIFTWVAFRPDALDRPLSADAIMQAELLAKGDAPDGAVSLADQTTLDEILALESETLRAWALLQAERIYTHQHDIHEAEGIDFSLVFGKAECHFALRRSGDVTEYKELERAAIAEQLGTHREHRWTVELAQIRLISRARLLWHQLEDDGPDVALLRSEVETAYTRLHDALHGAPDHTVRIFSHLQRRNLTEEQLRQESQNLKDQILRPTETAS